MFLNLCSQSVQCNFPWPYTANSIVNQLTQLFSHMFIQAYTDYWNVRPAVRPYVLNSLISVFEYCSGLNSAIFTEWDSFQYLYTALVLNSVILNRNSYIYGHIQYSCTVLVLIQLYSLNGTHSSIHILLWSYFNYIYCLGLNLVLWH